MSFILNPPVRPNGLRTMSMTLLVVGVVSLSFRSQSEAKTVEPIVKAVVKVVPETANVRQPACNGADVDERLKESFEGIRQIGPNHFEIDQAEVDQALADLSTLATQSRIVPAFKDGVAIGFKLYSLRPNSLQAKLGFQNGDTILRVNGHPLNSANRAFETYAALKQSKEMIVDVQRREEPFTLTYTIVP